MVTVGCYRLQSCVDTYGYRRQASPQVQRRMTVM
ncbi:hypothetical protein METHPM2_2010009 [Pseudomonas sp. PM2]